LKLANNVLSIISYAQQDVAETFLHLLINHTLSLTLSLSWDGEMSISLRAE